MVVVFKTKDLAIRPYSKKLKEICSLLYHRLRENPVEEVYLSSSIIDEVVSNYIVDALQNDDLDATIEIVTIAEDAVYVSAELYHCAGYLEVYRYIAIRIREEPPLWAIVVVDTFAD